MISNLKDFTTFQEPNTMLIRGYGCRTMVIDINLKEYLCSFKVIK